MEQIVFYLRDHENSLPLYFYQCNGENKDFQALEKLQMRLLGKTVFIWQSKGFDWQSKTLCIGNGTETFLLCSPRSREVVVEKGPWYLSAASEAAFPRDVQPYTCHYLFRRAKLSQKVEKSPQFPPHPFTEAFCQGILDEREKAGLLPT